MVERSKEVREKKSFMGLALWINTQGGGQLPGFVTLDQLIYWRKSKDGLAFSNTPDYWISMMQTLTQREKLYLSNSLGMSNRYLYNKCGILNPATFHLRNYTIQEMGKWVIFERRDPRSNKLLVFKYGEDRASFTKTAFGRVKL